MRLPALGTLALVATLCTILLMQGRRSDLVDLADGELAGAGLDAGDTPPAVPAQPHAGPLGGAFFIKDSTLWATVNKTIENPEGFNLLVAPLKDGKLVVPATVTRVVIEIGTNDEPEMTPIAVQDTSTLLIALEPRIDAFMTMKRRFPVSAASRLVAIPAAVSDTTQNGYVVMNVGGHKGCSSLLPMSQRMRAFARKQQGKARRKSQAIQLRTVEWCAMNEGTVEIPAISIASLLAIIPERLALHLIMTDAQGFDTNVISTLPKAAAKRLPFITTECQDLHPSDLRMMLVEGAPTCADQRRCMEAWFPHRLEYCWYNAPKVRELNCIYAHPNLQQFSDPVLQVPPKKLKIVGVPMNISYDARPQFSCPRKAD
jgi:FkbM family methyltransferase